MQQIAIPVLACGKTRYCLIPPSLPGVVLLPLWGQALTIGWVAYWLDEQSQTQGLILTADGLYGWAIVQALGMVIFLSLWLISVVSTGYLTYGLSHLHQFLSTLANHPWRTRIILSPIQELTTLALMLHSLAYQRQLLLKGEAGRTLMANQAANTMFGASLDRLLGHCEHDFDADFGVADTPAVLATNHARSLVQANMSHERCISLNAILSSAQIWLRMLGNASADPDYLRAILGSGDHSLHLINSVLDLAKIKTGDRSLQPESCALPSFWTAVVSRLGTRAGYQGLQLQRETDLELPSCICTSTQKLLQVLPNLLGYAVKFTQAGKIVWRVLTQPPVPDQFYKTDKLTSHGATASSRWERYTHTTLLYFGIEDLGHGIADSQFGSIFEVFAQGNTLINSMEGTGLALTISRNYIRRMGGDMGAMSLLKLGSCPWFAILLMLNEAKVASLGQLLRQVIGLVTDRASYRIFLVEDHLERGDYLKQRMLVIGLDGYDVAYGQAAIAFWESWHPHLTWVDLAPSIGANERVVSQIRSQCRANPDLPLPIIIAITPTDQDSDGRQRLPKGCDDWLSKPIQDHPLFEKSRQYLKVRYTYSDAPLEATSSPNHQKLTPTVDQLKTMPLEWIQTLFQAAYRCDVNHIFELIKVIRSLHPHLIEALNYLTSNLLFDQRIQLTEPLYNA